MENKLEQLLNMLIQRGWKPFGKGWLNLRKLSGIHQWWLLLHEPSTRVADNYSLRDIVSKSSWLWQFVCENGMVDMKKNKRPAYRLIESSLKDESELEDFLLQNIKVDVESK